MPFEALCLLLCPRHDQISSQFSICPASVLGILPRKFSWASHAQPWKVEWWYSSDQITAIVLKPFIVSDQVVQSTCPGSSELMEQRIKLLQSGLIPLINEWGHEPIRRYKQNSLTLRRAKIVSSDWAGNQISTVLTTSSDGSPTPHKRAPGWKW